MNHRPALDVHSFQRLLHAAWVLQCKRDRELSELNDGAAPDAGSPAIVELPVALQPVSKEPILAVPGAFTDKQVDAIAIPSVAMPIPPMASSVITNSAIPATVSSPTEVAGAPVLAPHRPWPPKKKDPIPLPASEAHKQAAWRAILVSEISRRAAPILTKLKAKEASLPRLRVIIPSRTTRAARAYTGPVVVLLIVLVFVLFQMFSHRAGLTSVKASTEPTPAAVQGSWESLLDSSHLRMTDSAASSVVEDLSRYEMRTVRRQAQYGDDNAALALGMAYEIGRQVPQSCTQATQWIALAAEEGNAAAQYNLALRYANGDGTPKNQGQAEKWLQTAARNGNQQAAIALNEVR